MTAANRAYTQAMTFLRFGGRCVCIGLPEGELKPIATAFPQVMIAKEQSVVGVAVGNRRDAVETLDYAARGIVKTHYRTEKMENLTKVFEDMDKGLLQGRVVLDLQA